MSSPSDHVKPAPTREVLDMRVDQVYSAMAMLAGMQLDLFTQFQDGPQTMGTVAERLSVDAATLGRLLYALVGAELLEVKDGRFCNSTVADHLLVRGKPSYIGGVHELWSDLWAATLQTAESVRSGKPQARHDFESMPEEEVGKFLRGQHPGAVNAGRLLGKTLSLSGSLLDVGGGSGGLSIGACEVVSGLVATIAELPQIAPTTGRFLDEARLTHRIRVVPVNLATTQIDGTYDTAILRHVLQTMSPESARSLLRNVAKAVRPGGEIYVIGWMLEDSRVAPTAALNFDLVFLNVYDNGAAYTVGEQMLWLEDAGFSELKCVPAMAGTSPVGTTMLSGRKS